MDTDLNTDMFTDYGYGYGRQNTDRRIRNTDTPTDMPSASRTHFNKFDNWRVVLVLRHPCREQVFGTPLELPDEFATSQT